MRLITILLNRPAALLSFLIIVTLFLVDFSFIFPNNNTHNNDLHAQTIQKITMYFSPASLTVTPGMQFTVPVIIDSGSTGLNAVQADITYPKALLEVVSIDDAGSAFDLSVLKTASEGDISIVRGSFTPVAGNNLLIAKVNFKALSSGIAPLEFKESSAAVNGPTDSLTESPGITLTLSHPSSPSPSPKPSPSPSPQLPPSPPPSVKPVIKIYAAGSTAAGAYPEMKLEIKNPGSGVWNIVKTFKNVRGNIKKRTFQEFTYTHNTFVSPSDIRIRFTNDWYKPNVGDRNLLIDRISVDGVTIQTERVSTYSEGSWSSTGCAPGLKKSEWLHCNGFFEFR